jgi:hypothetical protein
MTLKKIKFYNFNLFWEFYVNTKADTFLFFGKTMDLNSWCRHKDNISYIKVFGEE